LRVEVLGPAASWSAVEPATVSLFPGGEGGTTVRFRPPRAWTTAAGSVPVGVRVASVTDPSRTAVEECQVEIGPFQDVSAQLPPQRSRGRFRARHDVHVRNLGNAPADVTVTGRRT